MHEVPRPARVRMLLSFAAGALLAALVLVIVEAEPTEASSRYEDLGLSSSVVEHVRRHYVDSTAEHDLLSVAHRGRVPELSPHPAVMQAVQHREQPLAPRGEFRALRLQTTQHGPKHLHRGCLPQRGDARRPRRHPGARPDRENLSP